MFAPQIIIRWWVVVCIATRKQLAIATERVTQIQQIFITCVISATLTGLVVIAERPSHIIVILKRGNAQRVLVVCAYLATRRSVRDIASLFRKVIHSLIFVFKN